MTPNSPLGPLPWNFATPRSGEYVADFTDHMPPETKQSIERRLGNVPVEFEESGKFIAF